MKNNYLILHSYIVKVTSLLYTAININIKI